MWGRSAGRACRLSFRWDASNGRGHCPLRDIGSLKLPVMAMKRLANSVSIARRRESGEQVADLLVDIVLRRNRVRDRCTQPLAVPFPQAVNRHARRSFAQAYGGGERGVGIGVGLARQDAPQRLEHRAITLGFVVSSHLL